MGRPGAARVYMLAAIAVPVSIAATVSMDLLPIAALAAILPSLLLIPAFRWALRCPQEPVPIGALGGNVIWNLSTNLLLCAALVVSMWRDW